MKRTDPKTGTLTEEDLGDNPVKSKEAEIAFTYRRVVPASGEVDGYSEVDIDAKGLREILKKVIGTEYQGVNLEGDSINIVSPFACLVSDDSLQFFFQYRDWSTCLTLLGRMSAGLSKTLGLIEHQTPLLPKRFYCGNLMDQQATTAY